MKGCLNLKDVLRLTNFIALKIQQHVNLADKFIDSQVKTMFAGGCSADTVKENIQSMISLEKEVISVK